MKPFDSYAWCSVCHVPIDVEVSIDGGDQTVQEDAGQVKVCVSLSHPPLVPVSVTLTTEDGTALGK